MSRFVWGILLLAIPGVVRAEDAPLLMQRPTLSKSHIVFTHADDLWIVPREGGEARRLTSTPGLETAPCFSPDGSMVAYTGEADGNFDVYVVPTTGGEPRRLTTHPGVDMVVGWTPDGKNVLFRSGRASYARFNRLYTVPVTGGMPTELPLPMAEEGSLSADGKSIAYVPFTNQQFVPDRYTPWKRYRGGKASPIWIAQLADSSIEKLPRDKSNDFNPMYVGEAVYFLSDRDGATTLYRYDPATKKVAQMIPPGEFDIRSAQVGPGAIVYETFGGLNLFDLTTEKTKPVTVKVMGDYPLARPRFEKIAKGIEVGRLSPTGARAVFEARGEIVTVPAEKGDARNLTETPGVAERDPAWSPDGQSLAYFSDESGEYKLHVRAQNGTGEVKKFTLGDAPSFYTEPVWSPDGKKIAYTDKRGNLWILDLATSKSTKVDTNYRAGRLGTPAWSPDGKWLTYAKGLKNYLGGVFVYSLETGKSHPVSDGMSDAASPVFDASGKYLYFLASTDSGVAVGSEMSTINRPLTRVVYVVVLRKDLPSPLLPESDEEKAAAEKKEPEKKDTPAKPAEVRIDLEDLDQRILALPIPARRYQGLQAGPAGVLFLSEAPLLPGLDRAAAPTGSLHRFDLAKRKVERILDEVREATVSGDGQKVLYRKGDAWFIVPAATAPKPGDGALKLDGVQVRVDPRAEWRQMFREVWRLERDFLYDPGYHGLDIAAAEKKFEKYLPGLGSRRELNYLFDEMLGKLTLGHVYIQGGDVGQRDTVPVGLLGADYTTDQGKVRFARIYRGESWNPQVRAPLTQPGAGVKEGEYLLSVNGKEVRAEDEVYRFFEGTANKAVTLKVGPKADGSDAREVTVVPVMDEQPLRHLTWVADNRRKVDQLSDGKVAYVYMPNTHYDGFTRFNREFYAQVGKEALILDERFNGGGWLADHIIDTLGRKVHNYGSTREGEDSVFPRGAIFGPKVMLINEQAGSGGDYMPYTFRQAGLGTLIGKRTWGGLVGIGGYPRLIDGGGVTAPHWALWFPNGKWDVENNGVAPDIEVEHDPKAVRAGQDPQLEKAVALVLEELKKNPPSKPARPAYPNYQEKR
jgi:tricorn protease